MCFYYNMLNCKYIYFNFYYRLCLTASQTIRNPGILTTASQELEG